MKDFEHLEPSSLKEAISWLVQYRGRVKVMAGGTDLIVGMKQAVVNPEYLINLKRIPHLDSIDYDEREGFKIGALTTLRAIETSPLVREKIDILAQAARQIGATRIRSIGTIGGNLCQDAKCQYYARFNGWGQTPCYRQGGDVCYLVAGAKSCQAMATAETAPALMCLEAKATITGPEGERTLPIEELFVSAGVTKLQPDEVISVINIPNPPAHAVGVYLKHSVRGALDFAVAGVAMLLSLEASSAVCRDARIGLIGVARTPIRARRAEDLMNGKKINDELSVRVAQTASEEAHPVGDIYGSATYRRRKVNELVRKAIGQALEAA